MSFVLNHGLTSAALIDLLSLLNLLLPIESILPQTKYLFTKFVNHHSNGIEFHLLCPDCNALLGTGDSLHCMICDNDLNKKELINKGSFFIYMNIKNQIEDKLADGNISRCLFSEKNEDSFIKDIQDGKMYKTFLGGELCNGYKNLSLSMNFDGAPVFESSSFSIWPMQLMINELPPEIRRKNMMIAGLWFGRGKPPCLSIFEPFTRELDSLAQDGVKWFSGNEVIMSKVYLAVCPVDSVCRCVLQNMKQFNGEYGCPWCLNKGEMVEKGGGYVRVYKYNDVEADKRTMTENLQHVAQALESSTPVYGVKGPSPLMNVKGFDVIHGIPPDCLHAVFLGVTRQLTGLWVDSRNHDQNFYIGGHINTVDCRLEAIRPTSELTRLPRSLAQRAYWKGSEWRSWLLFYSLVVLRGILPDRYLRHLMLLVDAVFRLSRDKIDSADMQTANASLTKFVILFKDLYGDENLSFNVHQLLHLTPAVKNWGPLWSFSSMWFEGYIGTIQKLFHGTQAVPMQIARSFQILQGIKSTAKAVIRDARVQVPPDVESFLNKLLHGQVNVKKCASVGDVHMVGIGLVRQFTIEEKYAVDIFLGKSVSGTGNFYKKCISNGIMLQSRLYRETKRVNYIVGLENGEAAIVENLVMVHIPSSTDRPVAIVRFLEISPTLIAGKDSHTGASAKHIKHVSEVDDMIRVVDISEINCKFICITQASDVNSQIISALPNLIERD